MKCPYCEKEIKNIVPEFIFCKDGIILTECPSCNAGWLTIASESCDSLEKLGEMVGDMMGFS